MVEVKQRGQGSIEYLLLLAAAVVVVAVVISFMISTIGPAQTAGDVKSLDYICKDLDTNSFDCGCYLCDKTRVGVNRAYENNPIAVPDKDGCDALSKYTGNSLFGGAKCGW